MSTTVAVLEKIGSDQADCCQVRSDECFKAADDACVYTSPEPILDFHRRCSFSAMVDPNTLSANPRRAMPTSQMVLTGAQLVCVGVQMGIPRV